MVLDKHNLKRTDRQQLKNPSIRQQLQSMGNRRGLEEQARNRPSVAVRQQGLAMGGAKRSMKENKELKKELEGGAKYHSTRYKMTPVPQVIGGMVRNRALINRRYQHRLRQLASRIREARNDEVDELIELVNQEIDNINENDDILTENQRDTLLERANELLETLQNKARQGGARRGRPKKMKGDEEMEGSGRLEITHYEGGAKALGKDLMKEMMKDKDLQKLLKGSGFFDKFVEGLKEAGKGFIYPVKAIGQLGKSLPLPAPLKAVATVGNLFEGVDDPQWVKGVKKMVKGKGKNSCGGKMGSPLQIENPNVRGKGKKNSSWIELVKKVQNDKGVSYKEAMKLASKMRK
jgi:hypothetical protein